MPRTFGQIRLEFWMDEINEQSDAVVKLALFLIAGEYTNSLGCYKLPLGNLGNDLRWDQKKALNVFQELIDFGMVEYCKKSQFVWVKNFIKHNPPLNSKHEKGIAAVFNQLPDSLSLKKSVAEMLKGRGIKGLCIPDRSGIDTASIAYRSKDKKKEIEKEKEIETEDCIRRLNKEIDTENREGEGIGKTDLSKTASRLDAKSPPPPIGPVDKFSSPSSLQVFLEGLGYRFNLGNNVKARVEEVLPMTAEEVGLAVGDLKTDKTNPHPMHFVADHVEFNR